MRYSWMILSSDLNPAPAGRNIPRHEPETIFTIGRKIVKSSRSNFNRAGLLVCGLGIFGALTARSAEPTTNEVPALKNAVVLIIRHAEKPDGGYDLSPAGYKRADAYPGYFKGLMMDSQPLKLDY